MKSRLQFQQAQEVWGFQYLEVFFGAALYLQISCFAMYKQFRTYGRPLLVTGSCEERFRTAVARVHPLSLLSSEYLYQHCITIVIMVLRW